MITMNELVDLRMQQHIAHEIYRQQIMQRIPDPFPPMLPIPMPRHVIMPPRVSLPGVDVNLQNNELWRQFHQIGTEMIITKSGRRMFPSLRLSLSGLEEEANYCVLLEMVPIGDCRYKFSGSQWVPAGGAEPQSPQRMYLHPDSPASGAHWQAQPILFNKVKLTNNTLDNNGHIVLASMHKYQPRIHIIRTADLTQIPWAPQQAFLFPETEFVAVTAYQNDRITKLKIDNNPFAKGFRETGQSRCKRKMSSSPSNEDHDNNMQQEGQQQRLLQQQQSDLSPMKSNSTTNSSDSVPSICFDKTALGALPETNDFEISQQIKRIKSNGSACSTTSQEEINIISGISEIDQISRAPILKADHDLHISAHGCHQPPNLTLAFGNRGISTGAGTTSTFMHNFQQNMQTLLRPSIADLACTYFNRPQLLYPPNIYSQHTLLVNEAEPNNLTTNTKFDVHESFQLASMQLHSDTETDDVRININESETNAEVDIEASSKSSDETLEIQEQQSNIHSVKSPTKRNAFSISAILGGNS
ncbi:T-box transcription factor T-like [Teleopsis dalmanni]|uniref:T-box transcription factor T-like n=1 Tax=Teleopsis dalmanni TaxID=139649 RepID=UPI0018CF093E|nr:T-box transcription factor T-like [Teleopsis dalmanni]